MTIRALFATAAALALSACVTNTSPTYVAAADPTKQLQDPGYTSVTAGVKDFQVTGPKDWIEQNREVGPEGTRDRGTDSAARARRGR